MLKTLKSIFGFSSFKPGQEDIITNILHDRDVFAAMPTGGGKSLCYQLPALLLPGLTIVISPLIALMKDQVDSAKDKGIPAEFLNSSLTTEEVAGVYGALQRENVKLLYISPERFAGGSFLRSLKELNVSLFAVDEAHCLSEWGHDFRPDYLSLSGIRTNFPDIPIAGFTATATLQVQEDIIRLLNMKDPFIVRASFDRRELCYRITGKNNALSQILSFIREHPKQPGIVYRTTRKDVEKTVEYISAKGIRALPYHAGLDDEVRKRNQVLFNKDEVEIIVATIAFGMGIDKSNIRFVIHGDLPKSIEGYYQETGRAGRDGEAAHCLFLFSRGDINKVRYYIDNIAVKDEQERALRNLKNMVRFAGTNVCRRKALLNYFDETHPGNCGMCDICRDKAEREDATIPAQKFLSAVLRTGERFGANHIIDILRGADTEKIRRFSHHKLVTYGAGSDMGRNFWRVIADELIAQECLSQGMERFSGLVLGEKGRQVLFQNLKVFILKRSGTSTSKRENKLAPYDTLLFERLRKIRHEIARKRNLPPYMIFSDKSLHEMCARYPETREEFLDISGVGEHKLDQYGEIFLCGIKQHRHGGQAAPS